MTTNALLIVDVQKGFINVRTKHIPSSVTSLLPQYQVIFATKFFNPPNSNFRRLIGWERFSQGSLDVELAFKPTTETILIEKSIYSCVDKNFLSMLDKYNIEEVHICGIDTDICVMKCAVDLFDAGRIPIVLKDYCASHGGNDFHQSALSILRRYIGTKEIR